MTDFLQLVVSGTATGACYALAALAFTLLWQASGTINFALGEMVMLPAFLMLFCLRTLDLPLAPAFLLTCIASMLVLGWGFKKAVADPLIRHGVVPLVIATLGLSTALKQTVRAGYSADVFTFPSIFPDTLLSIGGAKLSVAELGTLLVAGGVVLALQLFLSRTLTGRSMQAVAQNRDAAAVLGINVERMVLYAFLVTALLAATSALLIAPTSLAKFDMGDTLGLKAFYAAIIGGFNQSRGALLGGVLVGVLENLVGAYISPGYKDGVALALFLAVILFRPQGLLGTAEERRV
ncbi:Branched-chain amino acid ABC transporter permease [Rhodovastum atsumiense]|uniref:Branched-chain amino acid ABC transporter permease n=1 Tax=Rhodovastum atsumiense TaxID=504468 RepID=A0A5M6J3N1_9PROT|nr:branched-chain amino acid ABC transporter permease [Rhodovastum atsumiense]KAA5614717.1 branched-chain amino acid ABC transporter permease [Rhodovastum atsumiense]CAH2599746.1 Branched-chain amino acid ABC transporter permease [Rhodovastum atsumiense]